MNVFMGVHSCSVFWGKATVNDIVSEMRRECGHSGLMHLPYLFDMDGKENHLHQACRWTKSETVVTMLVNTCGQNINGRDLYGRTPLHKAYMNEHRKIIVPHLLNLGADPEIVDYYGGHPEMGDPEEQKRIRKSRDKHMSEAFARREKKGYA